MIKFLIEYVRDKVNIKRALVEAATLTQAYIFFMCKYPSNCEIKEIEETTGENLPADVEFPQRPRVKYTIC